MSDLLKKACSVVGEGFKFMEKMQLLRPLELALLTLFSFIAGSLLSYLLGWGNASFSGFWVLFVALLVSKDEEIKLSELQSRLLAVALGVAAGFVVISVFGVNHFSLFIAVFLVVWACGFFKWHDYQQLAVMALAVLLISGFLEQNLAVWKSAIGRVLEAALGMLLAHGVQLGSKTCQQCCVKPSKPNNTSS